MISDLTGPLVGNARDEGLICLGSLVVTGLALPRFRAYRSSPALNT